MTSKHINMLLWMAATAAGLILDLRDLTQTSIICMSIWMASNQDNY